MSGGEAEVEVEFDGRRLFCAVEGTRALYAALSGGAAEACGCAPCRNYAAQRGSALPAPLGELCARLGVDPAREVELCRLERLAPGRHLYAVSFPFVGRLLDLATPSARDGLEAHDAGEGDAGMGPAEAGSVRFLPAPRGPLMGPAGCGLALLELSLELAWVLEEDEVP